MTKEDREKRIEAFRRTEQHFKRHGFHPVNVDENEWDEEFERQLSRLEEEERK